MGSFRLASAIGYSAVSVAPTSAQLTFADQGVYTGSPAQSVTETDVGTLPVSVSAVILGIDTDDFGISSSTCAAGVGFGPGTSCSVVVRFTPHGLGTRSAVLVIADTTSRHRRTVTLTGTATGPAAFTYPVDLENDVDSTRPFTWNALPQSQAYALVVASTPGGANLVNSGVLPATQHSYNVAALPANVLTYATVFVKVAGHWDHYQTVSFGVTPEFAVFQYPPYPGYPVDRSAPIQWTVGPQVQGFYLIVGTTPGSLNVINSGVLAGTQASYNHAPFPAHSTIYATIFTNWAGHWSYYYSTSFTTNG